MEPDPTILARQATATALVWPEPTLIAQPAGAGVTAQAAHGTPHESHPPAAAAALPEPAEPPDLDCLGDRIAELASRIDAATYELLCYLHQFNQQYGWEGFRSCAHWLNWRTGLDHGAAREKLRVAAALAELPHIAAAMACGRLSYSKVRPCRGWLPLPPRRGCWRWPAAPPPRRWSGWCVAGGRQTRPRRRMASRYAWRAAC